MENSEQNVLVLRLLDLRRRIHGQMEVELTKRKRENPIPTEEEIYLGAFAEQVEPQIRKAVFALVKKGYEFSSSGFSGNRNPQEQHLLGFFAIDDATKRELDSIGVKIQTKTTHKNQPITELSFNTDSDNLQVITEKWNLVADMLPKISDTMKLSPGNNSRIWRDLYASHRLDLHILDLERQIQDGAVSPEAENRMRRSIEKLKLQQRLREDLSSEERKKLEGQIAEIEEVEDEEAEGVYDEIEK